MLYKICTLNLKDNKIILVVVCKYSRLEIVARSEGDINYWGNEFVCFL